MLLSRATEPVVVLTRANSHLLHHRLWPWLLASRSGQPVPDVPPEVVDLEDESDSPCAGEELFITHCAAA